MMARKCFFLFLFPQMEEISSCVECILRGNWSMRSPSQTLLLYRMSYVIPHLIQPCTHTLGSDHMLPSIRILAAQQKEEKKERQEREEKIEVRKGMKGEGEEGGMCPVPWEGRLQRTVGWVKLTLKKKLALASVYFTSRRAGMLRREQRGSRLDNSSGGEGVLSIYESKCIFSSSFQLFHTFSPPLFLWWSL